MRTCVSAIGLRALPKAQLLLVLALVTPHSSGFAQGTLAVKNFGAPNVNAPVILPDGVTKLGPEFSALVFAGPTPTNMAIIALTPFLANGQAGYFDGGVQTLPDVSGGAKAFVQVYFGESRYLYDIMQPPGVWGYAPPPFQTVFGDPSTQPPTSPGTLSPLGTAPIVLALPTLVISPTDTNTLAFSWHVAPDQYALFARYILQQTSDLNKANWTTVTNLSRPQATTFYRLAIE